MDGKAGQRVGHFARMTHKGLEVRKISTVQVIDTLAEVTRHHDRELIERSLVTTLAELIPATELWFYRLVARPPAIQVALLAACKNRTIITPSDQEVWGLPPRFAESIAATFETGEVAHNQDPISGHQITCYPVSDRNAEICGLLVQVHDAANMEDERLTHGLLRVYTNYLLLLEDSQQDRLTGLLNRDTLDREITKIMAVMFHRQQRDQDGIVRRDDQDRQYWLAVVDVDFFKRVNDQFGHLYGDEVLILLARLLLSSFREEDRVFRFGGEEFVVVFRTFCKEDAERVCERLRKIVEGREFPQVGHITISIGVVEITNQEGTAGVIDQADQALYYSKEHGRNRVSFFQDLQDAGLVEDRAAPNGDGVDFF